MVVAIETGEDSASGSQCPPWIFPCDDDFDYYTKLVERCPAPDFREAELLTAGLGELIEAPVPHAEPVFVSAAIGASTGLGFSEQWTVGTRRLNVDPEPEGTHALLVARQTEANRLGIVALHTWVAMADHEPGHNFFRNLDDDSLVTMDHCSSLRPFFDGQPANPVLPMDLGNLLYGIAPDSPARTEVALRVRRVTLKDLKSLVATIPDDTNHPWLGVDRRGALAIWLASRRKGVANAICS
jgi:hypothetical protein